MGCKAYVGNREERRKRKFYLDYVGCKDVSLGSTNAPLRCFISTMWDVKGPFFAGE